MLRNEIIVPSMLQDTTLATKACSGLESAFFQQPAVGRQLRATAELAATPAVNILFLWACSVLVFMMQAGFAMVRKPFKLSVAAAHSAACSGACYRMLQNCTVNSFHRLACSFALDPSE